MNMFHRKLLCRICLKESSETVSIDSYLSNQINVGIQEALEKVMSLPLIINDVYPNQICRVCLGNLRISYEFRIEFEKSESILMKCYKNVQPSSDKTPETSCAPVEVIFGSNKYDLKDLVIVEKPQTTNVDFGGFLNNLGQSISAKFVKQFGVNSKQRSKTPNISIEKNPLKRSRKQRVKTQVLSIDNVPKNSSSFKIKSLVSSMEIERINDQLQFALMDQGGYEGFLRKVPFHQAVER